MRGFSKSVGFARVSAGTLIVLSAVGCSSVSTTQRAEVEALPRHAMLDANSRQYGAQRSGVVDFIWEEPMVDVIEVPPGLDPEGTYYRPAHSAVVEVRQGRWRYYKPALNDRPQAPTRAFSEESSAPIDSDSGIVSETGDLPPFEESTIVPELPENDLSGDGAPIAGNGEG